MREKLEWLLAGLVVYGGIFTSIVGFIYICRGLTPLFIK